MHPIAFPDMDFNNLAYRRPTLHPTVVVVAAAAAVPRWQPKSLLIFLAILVLIFLAFSFSRQWQREEPEVLLEMLSEWLCSRHLFPDSGGLPEDMVGARNIDANPVFPFDTLPSLVIVDAKVVYEFPDVDTAANKSQHDDLEAKFFEERAALEGKYQKLYQPLYTKKSGRAPADDEQQVKGLQSAWD
ncbi:hypothetical protein DH2020_042831 [Rehmannia glutinosa]|uniref:Uncharacterized protein n=1 Tax=Rehmannia glutinosa TaxID=99300 RepID=A0ABR0ULD0_REHGL